MKREARLTGIVSGNNMDSSMNFIPKMSYIFLLISVESRMEQGIMASAGRKIVE